MTRRAALLPLPQAMAVKLVLAPQYRRAWEIVTDVEGYQPFIDELKALRKPPR